MYFNCKVIQTPLKTKNMKKLSFASMALIALMGAGFQSCDKKNDETTPLTPTAQEFNHIRETALANLKQVFDFQAEDGIATFISENGVQLSINGNCLTKNGNPVSGPVKVEFVELFDRSNMLTTNKPTTGKLPDGSEALLISGGEFYIQATQDGQPLALTCGMHLQVPTALSGGDDWEMELFKGVIDDEGNLAWERNKQAEFGIRENQGGAATGNNYYAIFSSFGWTNVDRFYSDPRPKTTILVAVPEGYDAANSAVYLSYDGEPNALALLDTYDAETGLFSEHYGQIPVGLDCHVIFVSENNGQWSYAIRGVSIVEGGIITFDENDLATTTESGLTQLISDLP
ncbi:MAG: hypothetical protein HUU01_09710 [Saprospiraceae bacterium]|nr:hypothetical protein [Saprospiraceae bacterium]